MHIPLVSSNATHSSRARPSRVSVSQIGRRRRSVPTRGRMAAPWRGPGDSVPSDCGSARYPGGRKEEERGGR